MRLEPENKELVYTTTSGRVVNNADGTHTIIMNMVSTTTNAGWNVSLNYAGGMDWETWESQDGWHTYESDCGLGDHTTWLYSIMSGGSAYGTGNYEGSWITLTHWPPNNAVGLQVGEGANNKNSNFGFWGLFAGSGEFPAGEPYIVSNVHVYGDLDVRDDGSCGTLVYGCTDPTAFNNNSLANTDDGSCIEVVEGCTHSDAFNNNPLANTDDGSCIEVVEGCTQPWGTTYNPLANTDDGSCIKVVKGCTHSSASNYNPKANTDDGNCSWD